MNSGGVRARAELSAEPLSARVARRLVASTLRDWHLPHLHDAAVLLVSELVTNAVLHARTSLEVEVERRDEVVRVTVSDASPRLPQRRTNGLQSGTGRGLGLLASLSSAWGTGPADPPWHKCVWFELPLDPDAQPDPGEGAAQLL